MNIDELKSTQTDRMLLFANHKGKITPAYTDEAMRSGQLKLLEWLKKTGLLNHEIDERYQGSITFKPVCVENCRICELEAMLREGK